MVTTPRLPPDEEPLNPATVDLLFMNMGTDMILVGGQALAFWMNRYAIKSIGAAISNDGDVLGEIARARDLANAMRASLLIPPQRAMTSLVGQLRIPVGNGKQRNIDVLHKLFTTSGLKKSTAFTNQVIENSVKIEWKHGHYIQVMDPFDVLDSRVQNAVGLIDDKGPHVLTQVAWAIEVVREVIQKIASQAQEGDRLGRQLQRVFKLAKSSVGKRLLKEHDIEILDAIDLPLLRRLSDQHSRQLDKVEELIASRLALPAPDVDEPSGYRDR